MSIRKDKLLRIFLASILVSSIIMGYYFTREYLILTLVVMPILLVISSEPYLLLLTTFSTGLAVSTILGDNIVISILALVIAVSTTMYVFTTRTRDPGSRVLNTVLLFTPIYALQPRTLILGLTSVLSLYALVAYEYLNISKSKASILVPNPVVYLNEHLKAIVEIDCPGPYRYTVFLDQEEYEHGESCGSTVINVKKRTTRLGLQKISLKVSIQGPLRLARIEHGPFVVEYTVIARYMELYRRAEKVIKKYHKYLSVPIVLKASALALHSSLEAKTGEISPGLSVKYPVVPVLTSKGKKRIDKPGEGTSGEDADERPVKAVIKRYEHRSIRESKMGYELKLVWKTPRWLSDNITMLARNRLGEYVGVREYIPGDSLKLIHWKKSLRREDVANLAVKVYGASDLEEYAKKTRYVVIADLSATNPIELDLLLQSLYSYILNTVSEHPNRITRTEFFIYILTPRGDAYFIQGKPIDVLLALNNLVVDEKISALFEYDSWERFSTPISQEPVGALRSIIEYYNAYGYTLVNDLRAKGVEKGSVVFIYPRALSFKYFIVSYVFAKHNYIVAIPSTKKDIKK